METLGRFSFKLDPSLGRTDQLCLWFCLVIKRYLSVTIRYPLFNVQNFKQELSRLGHQSPEEIHEYLLATKDYEEAKKTARITSCLMIVFLLYACSHLSFAYTTLNMFDHANLSSNLVILEQSSSGQVFKFTCFLTNCSRLSHQSTSLELNLSRLPVFVLCEPDWSKLYIPITFISSLGLMIATILGFGVAVGGTVAPMLQILFPAGDVMLMFLTAPNLTTAIIMEKAKSILSEMSFSYMNYDRTNKSSRKYRQLMRDYHQARRESDLRASTSPEYTLHLITAVESYPEDFIPVVRTHWWRVSLMRSFCNCILVAIPISGFLAFWLLYYINSYVRLVGQQLHEFQSAMCEEDCAIWYPPGSQLGILRRKVPDAVEPILLDKLDHEWGTLSLIVTVVMYTAPTWSLSLIIICFFANNSELLCWLKEIKEQLEIVIGVKEYFNEFEDLKRIEIDKRKRFKIHELKEMFMKNTHLHLIHLFSRPIARRDRLKKPTRVGDEIDKDRFIYNLIAGYRIDLDSYIELVEKLYVNCRLLFDQIGQYARGITLVILISMMCNYGLVLIAVWYGRSTPDVKYQPLGIVCLDWLFVNGLILVASKFHARAKGLQYQMWKLVATIRVDEEDPRLVHLRYLWLQKVHTLGFDGGIALKAINVRITYVNILQMAVWTATMLVFAFDRVR